MKAENLCEKSQTVLYGQMGLGHFIMKCFLCGNINSWELVLLETYFGKVWS